MQVKSLLRYPGGKTRAVKILSEFVPEGITEMASPFFGGGSFELSLASKGVEVHGSDIYKPLVMFWDRLMNNPNMLYDAVKKLHPMDLREFNTLKATLHGLSRTKQAAAFYALNRSSFSGSTSSGGMSKGHPRFNEASIDRIKKWKCDNLSIENKSFEHFIPEHKDKFIYLDPPYDISNFLYGDNGSTHKGFDHYKLREVLDECDSWMMSYNDNQYIRDLYRDFEIVPLEWKYGMNASKKSDEILILNNI